MFLLVVLLRAWIVRSWVDWGRRKGLSEKGQAFENVVYRHGQLDTCVVLPTLILSQPCPLSSPSSPGAGAGGDRSP